MKNRKEIISINNIELEINPTDIISRQKRRIVEEEYIRERSVFAYMGKYAEANFTIILQFNIEDEISAMTSPDNLPTYLKLLAQIDNFPFVYIQSERINRYITPTIGTAIDHMIFGIESYTLLYSSESNNILTLKIDMKYFNTAPFCSAATLYTLSENPKQNSKSKIIAGVPNVEYIETEIPNIADSEIFDRYFRKDYIAIFDKMSEYKQSNKDITQKNIGETKVRDPIFVGREPEQGDYKKMVISKIDEETEIKVVKSTVWAFWPDLGEISKISNEQSPVSSISVTKYNNFASHSLAAWTYPVLQYMGKGATSVDIQFSENSLEGYSLRYLKTMLGRIDINQLNYQKYSQYNIIKIDNIVLDLLPMFGFILDNESIRSNANMQEVDNAYFRFIGKDIESLIDRRGFNTAHVRGTKIDVDTMIQKLLGLVDGIGKTEGRDRCMTGRRLVYAPHQDGREHHKFDNEVVGVEIAVYNKAAPLHRFKLANNLWPEGLSDRYLLGLEQEWGLEPYMLYNLMVAESGGENYRPDAPPIRSIDNAGGVFQIIPATARALHLSDVDNPRLSAVAAADFLSRLHKRYDGNTQLMLAAYNMGEPRLNTAIAKAGSTDWNVVKNHLHQAAVNETIPYVNKIMTNLTSDQGVNSGRDIDCFVHTEVEEVNSQLNNLANRLDKIVGQENINGSTEVDAKTSLIFARYYVDKYGSNEKEQATIDIIGRMVEEEYLSLGRQAVGGNNFLARTMSGTAEYIHKNHDRLVNSFEGEAYYDLELGDRLGIRGLASESGGEAKDVRDINPMFFMREKPYVTASLLETGYTKANGALGLTVTALSDSIEKKIVESTNANRGGGKNIDTVHSVPPGTSSTRGAQGQISDTFTEELADVKISKALLRLNDEIDADTIKGARADPEGFREVVQGIGNEDAQSQYYFPRSAGSLSRGINQAFPVIKVYIVEGDEDSIRYNFSTPSHEYYELTGISSVKIAHQDDQSPVDVALIRLANPGSIYTDHTVYMDILQPKKNWKAVDTSSGTEIPLNKVSIRPGNRIHVRGGYSNDINKLETMFNGIVTETAGEHTLEILCESYGRELVMYDHGDNPDEDNTWGGADTNEVIANFLYSGEIEHFGNIKWLGDLKDGEGADRRSFTLNNMFTYHGSHALFMNIYADSVIDGKYDFGAAIFGSIGTNKKAFPYFPIYKITPWEGLREMEYRHPGSLAKPCWYGARQTFFYGIKEQLYVWRDLNKGLIDNGRYTKDNKKNSYLRDIRLKPVCDFHLISSDLNIISNNLKVTSDFNTVVDIAYYDSPDQIRSKKYKWYDMKIDDNLKPMAHRKGRLEMSGIHGLYSAFVYGSTYLRKELEKMYDGKILIVGNQNVKSGDYAILEDATRGLSGIIKIRECVQHFDTELGFVTEITPGLYAESSHVDYSMLFTKLYMGYAQVLAAATGVARKTAGDDYLFKSQSLTIDAMGLSLLIDNNTHLFNNISSIFDGSGGFIPALDRGALLGGSLWAAKSTYNAIMKGKGVVPSVLRGAIGATQFTAGAVGGGVLRSGAFVGSILNKAPFLANSALASNSIKVASGLFKIGRLLGPVGWASMIIGAYISAYIEEKTLTRQPVRMFPLQMNGSQYVGGIWGYHEGGYWEDLKSNLHETANSITTIWGNILGE